MADEIINAFQRLPHEDRSIVLNGLLASITGQEWRTLQEIVAKRTFQVDIVGSRELPLEILILIFKHLPLKAAFIGQTVCKAWRYKLNSVETLTALLARPGYESTIPLLCEHNLESFSQLVLYRKRAERILRLQNLRPKHTFEIRMPAPRDSIRDMALPSQLREENVRTHDREISGHHLAWEAGDNRVFRILNLQNGSHRTISMPGRTRGFLLGMTTEFTIMCSYQILYAFDITTLDSPPVRLRLPSRFTYHYAAHDLHLAIFVLLKGYETGREVVVWNMRSGRSHSFQVELLHLDLYANVYDMSEYELAGVWLHAASGIITLFYVCFPGELDYLYVRIMQTDLKGHMMYDQHFEFDYLHRDTEELEFTENGRLCALRPSATPGIVHVRIGYNTWAIDPRERSIGFELDSSSTPPLQPDHSEFWLCAHPALEIAPRMFRYDGEGPGRGAHTGHGATDGVHGSHDQILCHLYSDVDMSSYGKDGAKSEDDSQIYAAIQHRVRSGKGRHQPAWSCDCVALHDLASYHAIVRDPSRFEKGIATFDVFAANQWAESGVVKIKKPLRIDIKTTENGSTLKKKVMPLHMLGLLVNESFVVVQVMTTKDMPAGTKNDELVLVVMAFDPDYEVPRALEDQIQWS